MAEILTIKLDLLQATAVAGLVLLLGMGLRNVVPAFKKFCIPAPVIGGLIYAILHCILKSANICTIDADMTLKNVFMTAFFCSVGFTASFRVLGKCGKYTLLLLALSVILVFFQDLVGTALAFVFNGGTSANGSFNPYLGLCVGSVPLVGGHGTSGAFGPLLEETYGAVGANTVAIAAATYGLVAGNLVGGPVANARITKLGLKSTDTKKSETSQSAGLDGNKMVTALMLIVIAVGGGTVVSTWIGKLFTLPGYIGAMIIGVIIRNVFDATNNETPSNEIDCIGNLCLQLFLGLAMMDLKLWQLVDLAIPMIAILAIQTVFIAFFAYFIAFNVLGKNYDAAVMTSALCGYGMGATPNAMVNMQAVTEKFGPSNLSFMAVPIVGGMFIDFFNAAIITGFANFLQGVVK